MKLRRIALGAAVLCGLTACVDDGYGGGLAYGYGAPGYYSDFYDGAYGAPYYGWYGGYCYPGSGYYVYDRVRRPLRWTDSSRGEEWRGFDRGPSRRGGDGYRWRGGRGRR